MDARRVEALRRHLVTKSAPRLTMAVVIALAGGAAFLASFSLLSAGLRAMGLRYLLATIVGYVAFLFLIKAWLSWQKRTANLGLDAPDVLPDFSTAGGSADPFSGGGGDFGGAGATGSWEGSEPASAGLQAASQGGNADLADAFSLDDAWPVVLAGVVLLGGAVAIGFVIYTSPVLFAEVLLDAAVLGTIYRRTRRHETGHWIGSVLRRTAGPATVLCVFMAVLGFALQAIAPGATSIGGVVRAAQS